MAIGAVQKCAEWATVLGVPAILVAVSLVVGYNVYDAGVTGRMEGKLDNAVGDLARIEATFTRRFDNLDLAAKQLDTRIEKVVGRVRDNEAEPLALLSRAGFQVDRSVAATILDGRLVLLAKEQRVEPVLLLHGFQKEQVTPFMYGWVKAQ